MHMRYLAYIGNAIIKYTLHHNYCLCHGYKHQPLAGESRRSGYPIDLICERRPYCSGRWAWRMETELGRRPDPKQVGPRRRLIADFFFFFYYSRSCLFAFLVIFVRLVLFISVCNSCSCFLLITFSQSSSCLCSHFPFSSSNSNSLLSSISLVSL